MTPGVGGDACWAEDRGEEIQTNPKIAKAEMDRSFGIQDQPDKLLHAPNGVNAGGAGQEIRRSSIVVQRYGSLGHWVFDKYI